MPVNPNWARWIFASVADYLHTAASAKTPTALQLVVEMLDKRNAVWEAAATRAEATISGPFTKEQNSGCYLVTLDVFLVITSDLAPSGGSDYDHIDFTGHMQNALDNCIICKDYGATGTIEIGTLTPENADPRGPTHLKPSTKDTQIHSTLNARFIGIFSE